ncbi:hypothetical protein GCM10010193_27480 [Kitasatospora atroaurantiaca]
MAASGPPSARNTVAPVSGYPAPLPRTSCDGAGTSEIAAGAAGGGTEGEAETEGLDSCGAAGGVAPEEHPTASPSASIAAAAATPAACAIATNP